MDIDVRRDLVLSAFHGPLVLPTISLGRRIGTLLVAAFLLLMPLFYLAVIAVTVAGLVWLSWRREVLGLGPAVYWLVMTGGSMALLCLLKPLVEPRRRVVEVHPQSTGKEPLLFEFVARVCRELDALPPATVQLECSTRIAATYHRGTLGLVERDVCLTLGLPLIACLSVEQFAGQIAGQMALHRRGAGCRATNLIRSINGWLWRSVYEGGRLDAWLALVAQRRHWHWAKLLLVLRIARIVPQAVLFVPMFLGNTVASGLVRLAEFDADRCAARLVGRGTFAASLQRLPLVEFAWQGVLAELDFLHRERKLPDDLPRQLAVRMLDISPEISSTLFATVVKQEEKPFDSLPGDEERLASMEGEPEEGVLGCTLPATVLWSDFEATARKLTWDYYLETFGPRNLRFGTKPVELPLPAASP